MRVIIAGGRNFENYTLLKVKMNEILKNVPKEEITIISGGAKGADSLGEKYARDRGLKTKRYEANWQDINVNGANIKEYGSGGYYNAKAGLDRNEKMAQNADALVAFWDGFSTGTLDMIKRATMHNLKIRIIKY